MMKFLNVHSISIEQFMFVYKNIEKQKRKKNKQKRKMFSYIYFSTHRLTQLYLICRHTDYYMQKYRRK